MTTANALRTTTNPDTTNTTDLKEWTDREVLDACIRKDNRAWRELVRRYDAPLRVAAYKQLRPFIKRLPSDFRDDVMGAFWLKIVDRDMRAIRCFQWDKGTALYKWFAKLVEQCAVDYGEAQLNRPEFVPVKSALQVADEGGVLASGREPFRGSLSGQVRRAKARDARAEVKQERVDRRRRLRAFGQEQ